MEAIRQWRKLPGAPDTPDVEVWKSYIEANDLGLGGNRVGSDREQLLCAKLEKEIKRLDINIEKDMRQLVSIDDVSAFVASLLLGVKQTVYQMARELPRQIVGDELAEAQAKAQPYADQVMVDLQGMVAGWWPEDREVPGDDSE